MKFISHFVATLIVLPSSWASGQNLDSPASEPATSHPAPTEITPESDMKPMTPADEYDAEELADDKLTPEPEPEPEQKTESDKPSDSNTTQNPEQQPATQEQPEPERMIFEESSHQFAVGFHLAWTSRQDYGSRIFRRLTPELVGFTYGALPWEEYWWRAGLRLGYSSAQPEMPQSVRIEETDTTTLAEIAITKDWYVVPSFAFGMGYDFRTTKLKTSPPIETTDDRLNRKERLWMWYSQIGAGLPLLKGMFLIEPTIRYHTIQYDSRSHWMFGIEATVGI